MYVAVLPPVAMNVYPVAPVATAAAVAAVTHQWEAQKQHDEQHATEVLRDAVHQAITAGVGTVQYWCDCTALLRLAVQYAALLAAAVACLSWILQASSQHYCTYACFHRGDECSDLFCSSGHQVVSTRPCAASGWWGLR